MIAAGTTHSLFVDEHGNVWGCGNNSQGQLGPLPKGNSPPTLIPEIVNVAFVAARNHSLFVDHDGDLWGCGINDQFNLGLPTNHSYNTITKIAGLPAIKSVAVTHNYSLALAEDGEVYATGVNPYGQLGVLGKKHIKGWTRLQNIPKIESLTAGFSHSLFVDGNGNVWSCGNNGGSRLGRSGNTDVPRMIPGLPPIKTVAAGWTHSLFLDNDKNVWAVGSNENYQLGIKAPSQSTPVRVEPNVGEVMLISAGHYHSIIQGIEGVFSCGKNMEGAMAVGVGSKIISKSSTLENIAIVQISTHYHSLFLDREGVVWSCGKNTDGQLGLGEHEPKVIIPETVNGLPAIGRFARCSAKSARKVDN